MVAQHKKLILLSSWSKSKIKPSNNILIFFSSIYLVLWVVLGGEVSVYEVYLNIMPNIRKCEGIIQNTETLWGCKYELKDSLVYNYECK